MNLLAISNALLGDHMALSVGGSFLLINTINAGFMLSQVALIHLFTHQLYGRIVVTDHKQTWLYVVCRQHVFLSILFFLLSSIYLLAVPEIERLRGCHPDLIISNAATNLVLLKTDSYFSFFVWLEDMQILV